jgi:hypothetical protein
MLLLLEPLTTTPAAYVGTSEMGVELRPTTDPSFGALPTMKPTGEAALEERLKAFFFLEGCIAVSGRTLNTASSYKREVRWQHLKLSARTRTSEIARGEPMQLWFGHALVAGG